MGNTQPYFLKSGQKRWEHRYRRPDGSDTRKRGFKTRREAEAWAATNTVELNAGTWIDRSLQLQTVAQAADEWLNAKKPSVAPKTALAYADAVRHIKFTGRLGATPIGKVRASTIEAWLVALSEAGLSANSIRAYAKPLSQVFDRAVRDGRLTSTPFVGVVLPRVQRREMEVPTAEEIAIIVREAGAYGHVVELLTQTGLRWSEMAGLQVRDVDLTKRRIYIRRQLFEVVGRLEAGAPKHGKNRTVPMTTRVAEILEERTADKDPTDLVFTTLRGKPLRNGNARRGWWNQAVAAAGHPGWTPHVTRHYFASTAISAGASIKALSAVLGHASEAFSLSQYGWLMRDDLDSFVHDLSHRFNTRGHQESSAVEGAGTQQPNPL